MGQFLAQSSSLVLHRNQGVITNYIERESEIKIKLLRNY